MLINLFSFQPFFHYLISLIPSGGRLSKVLLAICFCLTSIIYVSAQSELSVQPGRYLDNLYDQNLPFDTSRIVAKELSNVFIDPMNGWKDWITVNNYFFGQNRGSLPMIADLESLHPYFKDKIVELIQVCKASGISLAVVETYRTHAKQAEYFAMGRKYTGMAGGNSKHQYGLAVDVVPVVNAIPVWNNTRLWKRIGMLGERLGLRWGGRWRVPYDPAHFEWSGGTSSHQLAKGSMAKIPNAKSQLYPCIEDDIRKLKAYWDAWEVEQSVFANNPIFDSADQVSME